MMEKEKLAKLLENCPYLDVLGGLSYWDEAAEYLLANGVRLETNQATSDKTSDESKRWIPVSERMPEEHVSLFARMYGTERWMPGMFRMGSDEVLGAVRNNDGTISVQSMHTLDGEWSVSRIFQKEVTHWMPLPEPPPEERQ